MTTSLLKLAIPTEGSLDGTWGDVVNNGITQYLDIAVAGTTTLSTDADVDLTSTEGDVSGTNIVGTSAQHAVLLCSGARTALRNINTPKQSKTYVVINNTTGGFAVVVRGGPDTPTAGVSVAAGERVLIAWSGTDFVKVTPSTAGTLPVANGGTGATSLTANNVILGNGTSAVQVVAPGTTGNVLTSDGTTWVSAAAGGGSLTGITQSLTPFETALGFEAGLNTTGTNGTFVGYRAGRANIGGTDNTAVGWSTLIGNTTGISNTSMGRSSSSALTTGSYNSAFGATTGSGTTGNLNCSFGWNSHNQGTTSYENSAYGARSLQQITTGFRNTAVGYAAMQFTDTGNSNVAVGLSAGAGVTSGTQNTLLGANAAYTGTNNLGTGSNNTLIGFEAQPTSSSASNEVTIGNASVTRFRVPGLGIDWTSAPANLTGTTNSLTPFKTALGDGAGTSTTGTRVTAVGYRAAFANVSGTALTAVGFNALINAASSFTTAVGAFASEAESTGSNNTSLGYFANSACTTGIYNVSIGDSASGNVTGSYNVAIGQATHGRLTNSSSNYCVAVGALALNNVSGDNNTAIGYQAGRSLSSGTDNTLIGFNAGRTGTNNLTTGSNNILLGNSAQPTASTVSNEITLGNASIATLRCQVTSITSLSDLRDKTDVAPVQDALKLVNTLNPVRFTWNTRDGAKVGIPDMGFIAQELKAAQEQSGVAVPNLVYETNPDRMEAAYGTLIPVLVKAIQELSAEVAALKAKA